MKAVLRCSDDRPNNNDNKNIVVVVIQIKKKLFLLTFISDYFGSYQHGRHEPQFQPTFILNIAPFITALTRGPAYSGQVEASVYQRPWLHHSVAVFFTLPYMRQVCFDNSRLSNHGSKCNIMYRNKCSRCTIWVGFALLLIVFPFQWTWTQIKLLVILF